MECLSKNSNYSIHEQFFFGKSGICRTLYAVPHLDIRDHETRNRVSQELDNRT